MHRQEHARAQRFTSWTSFVALEPEQAELVKLRYFVGLKIEEAAEVLGISKATAKRWWAYARAWLFHEVDGSNRK